MRHIILRWEDLQETISENDKLSIICLDSQSGKKKLLRCFVETILHESADPQHGEFIGGTLFVPKEAL